MTAFGDALALASMYAEMTGCTIEEALRDMEFRATASQDDKQSPALVKPQAPEPPILKEGWTEFDDDLFLRHLNRLRPGVCFTAHEMCDALKMHLKSRAKHPARLMRSLGWKETGERRNNSRVYQKPRNGIAAVAE